MDDLARAIESLVAEATGHHCHCWLVPPPPPACTCLACSCRNVQQSRMMEFNTIPYQYAGHKPFHCFIGHGAQQVSRRVFSTPPGESQGSPAAIESDQVASPSRATLPDESRSRAPLSTLPPCPPLHAAHKPNACASDTVPKVVYNNNEHPPHPRA